MSGTSLSAGQHRSHDHPRLKRWRLHLLMGRLSRSHWKNTGAQGGEETLKPSFQVIYHGKERYEVMQSDAFPTNYHSSPSVRGHTGSLSASIWHIRLPWASWKEKNYALEWSLGKKKEGRRQVSFPCPLSFLVFPCSMFTQWKINCPFGLSHLSPVGSPLDAKSHTPWDSRLVVLGCRLILQPA